MKVGFKVIKKLLFIVSLLLVVSCHNERKEIRYYPTESLFLEKVSHLIGLDTTTLNFRQITDKAGVYFQNQKHITIEFNDDRIKKRVTLFHYGGGLRKYKNILSISSDSVLIDNKYPIIDLKRLLKRHYLNKGKIPRYSDSPKKAIVEVTIDTNKTGKELKQTLIKLTRSFDEIKEEIDDTIELKIVFSYFRQIPPPPPPPKTKEY